MVLCAGLGTRLRPFTNVWPKPAMPLLGQPLLRYAFSSIEQAGIREVGINTHHLASVMQATAEFEAALFNFTLRISHEPVIMGTGGGIRGLGSFLREGTSVIINGDALFAVDLAPIIKAHEASGAVATMVLMPMPEGETFAAVEMDADGFVRRIAGKGPGAPKTSSWHFTGVHVLSPGVFDAMTPEGPEDINREVYVRLLERGAKIRGHVVDSPRTLWSDVGTPKRYLEAQAAILSRRFSLEPFGSANPLATVERHEKLNAWVANDVSLGDARMSGPAWIGAGAKLGRGVRLGAFVSIGTGATIGDGAQLNRVAVLDGAAVGVGTLVEDSIIGPDGMAASVSDDSGTN